MEELFSKIESLNIDDFEVLLQFIDKTRRKRARQIMNHARRQAARLNMDGGVISAAKPTGKKSAKPARYADPENPDNTWSGFGRQPEWFKQYLENGGTRADMLL